MTSFDNSQRKLKSNVRSCRCPTKSPRIPALEIASSLHDR